MTWSIITIDFKDKLILNNIYQKWYVDTVTIFWDLTHNLWHSQLSCSSWSPVKDVYASSYALLLDSLWSPVLSILHSLRKCIHQPSPTQLSFSPSPNKFCSPLSNLFLYFVVWWLSQIIRRASCSSYSHPKI